MNVSTRPMHEADPLTRLLNVLAVVDRLAIAVSGGVDSMTLATAAYRFGTPAAREIEMFHARSPAVPSEATNRVRQYASAEGWPLRIVDAGEFDDENYRTNPLNRCYFCKNHLYAAIGHQTNWQIASGTNVDDLGEYRPGLVAAGERSVRHPYVEAGIDKTGVREIARRLGLHDLAELPASPCLASRVETGIRVEPRLLALVEDIERRIGVELVQFNPRSLRCRVRAERIVIEIDDACLTRIDPATRERLLNLTGRLVAKHGADRPVALAPYRVGSAFLHERRSH